MTPAPSKPSDFEVILFHLCGAVPVSVAHESQFLALLGASMRIPGVDDGLPGVRKAQQGAESREDEK